MNQSVTDRRLELRPGELKIVRKILQRYLPERTVWAFGSRVKGRAKPYSDLDLAVLGDQPLSLAIRADLAEDFSESDLNFKVDIVDWATTSERFRKIIKNSYVVIQQAPTLGSLGMTSEWEPTLLGDLVKIEHGWPFKSELYSKELTGKPIVVSIGNFNYTGGFRFDSTISKEYRGEYPEQYDLRSGDILLVMTCQTAGGEILGIPARVPDDGRRYLHNQRLGKVVIKDGTKIIPEFLYYLFLSPDFNRQLVISASGTKILHTAPSRIEKFEFLRPSIGEQRAIAHILGTLDSKIAANQKMNETLEAMARALFKSWFVDFDPVRAKAEGRDTGLPKSIAAIFPDSFEESELGSIPTGWTVRRLGEVSSYLSRGISPSYIEDGGVLVLNQKCIRNGEVDTSKGRRHDSSKRSIDGRTLQFGDILVNSTGVGTLGRVAQFLQANEEAIVDSHVTVIRADGAKLSEHYLGIAIGLRQAEIEALGEGSTGQTELSRSRLAEVLVLVPSRPIIDQFDRLCAPLRQARITNGRESMSLASLRDALLPRLISGEMLLKSSQAVDSQHEEAANGRYAKT
jgi:type I restriction enzyme S subunit